MTLPCPLQDDLELEDMASTSENSEECHTESNQPPIHTDLATHDIADRVVEAFRKSNVFQGLDDTILLQVGSRSRYLRHAINDLWSLSCSLT